jgi:hypothetical protein
MGAWALTNNAKMRLAKGNWNIDTATLKVPLYLSTSNLGATSTTAAGVTNEHAAANGYSTGGPTVDLAFAGTTSISVTFVSNPSYTASGGSIVARKAAIVESGGDVLAYKDLDTVDVTTTTGNTLTLDNDGVPDAIFVVS